MDNIEFEGCEKCIHTNKKESEEPCCNCRHGGYFRDESRKDYCEDITTGSKVHPAHYNNSKITPFDVIDDWGLDFYLGNSIKYIKRAGYKPGESAKDDLTKAINFLSEGLKRLK